MLSGQSQLFSPSPVNLPLLCVMAVLIMLTQKVFAVIIAVGRAQDDVDMILVRLGLFAKRDAPLMVGLIRDAAPNGSVFFLRVSEIVESPCIQGGEATPTNPSAVDLLAVIRRLEHLTVSDPTTVRVGGYVGQQVDVTISEAALAACGGLAGGDVTLFLAGGESWRALPGERFRLIALDVKGQAVTIVLSTDWTVTPSVQELEALYDVGRRVLDSVRF